MTVNSHIMQKMSFPVKREGRVTWEDGVSLAGDIQEFEIRGMSVPLTGRDLLLVPEADRFKVQIWIFTEEDLQNNDIVVFQGANYAVQNVEPWYWYKRARAMRVDVGTERKREDAT